MAVSSPDRMSPALIGLPALACGSAVTCDDPKAAARMTAQAQRVANRGFVMSQMSAFDDLEQSALAHRSR
jgi:hypothetical protein